MDILLYTLFLGTPLWLWFAFIGIVVALLAFDLGVLNKTDHEIGVAESLKLSAMYITLGVTFGGFVWWQFGPTSAAEYMTAFVVEKTLALDNVFVIALIFSYFAIPRQYQHRVLFWGILGVIVLRGVMIGLGAVLIAQYGWILYIFAAFLIFTGIKMLVVGHMRRQAAPHDVVDPQFDLMVEPDGRRFPGVKDRALAGQQFNRPERAAVGGRMRVGRRFENHLRRDHDPVARGIHRPRRLAGIVAQIDFEGVIADRDLEWRSGNPSKSQTLRSRIAEWQNGRVIRGMASTLETPDQRGRG